LKEGRVEGRKEERRKVEGRLKEGRKDNQRICQHTQIPSLGTHGLFCPLCGRPQALKQALT
jgi:hypothetical protein